MTCTRSAGLAVRSEFWSWFWHWFTLWSWARFWVPVSFFVQRSKTIEFVDWNKAQPVWIEWSGFMLWVGWGFHDCFANITHAMIITGWLELQCTEFSHTDSAWTEFPLKAQKFFPQNFCLLNEMKTMLYGAQNKMINPFHILSKQWIVSALEAGVHLDRTCHQNTWITLDSILGWTPSRTEKDHEISYFIRKY